MPNYCIGQIYLISNAIFISFVLPWFDIYPDFLVKLLSLLSEPHVIVFAVYGKPESAGAVLVGFELQNDIVRPKRMIIPYRVQFPRVSVRLHRR